MAPLICTQNSYSHIDYGTPLLALKSTDYRTSTGKNHRFIAGISQDFDCRVKAKIKPELLDRDVTIRDEYKSIYSKEYNKKSVETDILKSHERPMLNERAKYIRNNQEKLFMKPPPIKPSTLSEMKDTYRFHQIQHSEDKVMNNICKIPETYQPIQPNINPAEKGYYKLLDIYLTENKSNFVPCTNDQLKKAQEDIITYYNSNGKHKGFPGELPGKSHGRTNMYDKSIFKIVFPNRFLSSAPKRVPNFGMVSEYQSNYPKPALSDFYPYLKENGVYFTDSLSNSSQWQDLCPPAMYCTENCHIGTSYPVRAVIDINNIGKKLFISLAV
ncbi:uncharacterized protein LOC115878360 [Sitophilus oryzae]|uniref:Uncharacterized protein LOC115878360 n=1 Tax=Sitophilus oryzae TaxID=7048 RepID=A0A6J2XIE8_SITOR|nr:uncharacterized protein LOC115878360 [Sitophilus oryzae]